MDFHYHFASYINPFVSSFSKSPTICSKATFAFCWSHFIPLFPNFFHFPLPPFLFISMAFMVVSLQPPFYKSAFASDYGKSALSKDLQRMVAVTLFIHLDGETMQVRSTPLDETADHSTVTLWCHLHKQRLDHWGSCQVISIGRPITDEMESSTYLYTSHSTHKLLCTH